MVSKRITLNYKILYSNEPHILSIDLTPLGFYTQKQIYAAIFLSEDKQFRSAK